MKLSFAPLVAIAGLLVSEVQASLNCTVVGQPLEYRSCEYPDCPVVGTYTVGAQIQAACRSDCSSDQNIWYWLYNRYYAQGGARVTGCNYSGIPFAQTGLPYCYQEQNRPRPTTCTRTSFATATPTTTARTTTTSSITTRTTTNSPTRPTTPPITSTTTTRGNCGSLWSQCGGIGWSGPTCCTSGTCRSLNAYYSQCIN